MLVVLHSVVQNFDPHPNFNVFYLCTQVNTAISYLIDDSPIVQKILSIITSKSR